MSDYIDGCILHKQVQRGIIEQRPVSNSKKKSIKNNWLTVYWHNRDSKWHIWNEYSSEELAHKQMTKMIRY